MWSHEGLAGSDILFQVWLQERWFWVHSSVLKSIRENQDHFVPQSVPIRGTGNGLGRTQRNQNTGCPTARASPPQPGPTNNSNKGRRNKQEEPLSGPDPMQTLSQVLQLLQTLPLDPSVKDNLRDSLQGHVAPMLQPKKSTAELIHEKQTERANEESARVIKQNKYDLLMTNVQKISQKIDGHVQRMATLDNELLDLHAALQLQKPITEPPPPEGAMPTVQEVNVRRRRQVVSWIQILLRSFGNACHQLTVIVMCLMCLMVVAHCMRV